MPRTYVDNAYNRQVGRVGLPVGSAVISSGSRGSSSFAMNGGVSYGAHSTNYSGGTYVDNAYNRRVGRVGLPLGSAVISKSGSSALTPSYNRNLSSVSPVKTYVDNDLNRKLGRVGMPHGSAVYSSSPTNSLSTGPGKQSSGTATYVDNSYNRKLGRVSLPRGSAVESFSSRQRIPVHPNLLSNSANTNRVYVDNAMNRRLGRVGMPHGSMVVRSKLDEPNIGGADLSDIEKYFGTTPKVQTPRSPHATDSSLLRDVFQHLLVSPEKELEEKYQDIPDEKLNSAVEAVLQHFTRVMEVKQWKNESKLEKNPAIEKRRTEKFTGATIKFEDIELRKVIGSGAFGDVHAAKYEGSLIAVKKLRVQRVSKKRQQSFIEEIQILCNLKHPNVVKFIGACVITPNLCICMEFMKLSLHEALHMHEMDLTEMQKLKLISDVTSGLEYLHSCRVAHCDIKSQNVLLDYDVDSMDDTLTAKLSDFGLSMMKNNSESMTSMNQQQGLRGTPRYSAPEVLRGEMMSFTAWKYADVYSLSLVIYEIICNEEPFEGLSIIQLSKQVGSLGAVPEIERSLLVKEDVKELLTLCWSRNADERPAAMRLKTFFKDAKEIFQNH